MGGTTVRLGIMHQMASQCVSLFPGRFAKSPWGFAERKGKSFNVRSDRPATRVSGSFVETAIRGGEPFRLRIVGPPHPHHEDRSVAMALEGHPHRFPRRSA